MYQIPCQDCDSVYTGETGRSLGKRITKHKNAVKNGDRKNGDRKNGLAVHAWDEEHRVDWEGESELALSGGEPGCILHSCFYASVVN